MLTLNDFLINMWNMPNIVYIDIIWPVSASAVEILSSHRLSEMSLRHNIYFRRSAIVSHPFMKLVTVTYGQVWWPILGICALQLTHPKCTYTAVNTHPEQWAAIYAAAPGEQLVVRCLAQGYLSRGIEGGESTGYSLPPPTIPAGPRLELATFGLRVQLSNH